MPYLKRGDATIHYEEFGSGFPILLFAPGSLQSCIDIWHRPMAPLDPTKVLADKFRLIALDLRNAAESWAPIRADDGWHCYTDDHVALLDHLGVDRCHLMGQCIGGPLSMAMLKAVPQRIAAAVLIQPSGRIGPPVDRPGSGFDRWREQLTGHPEATPEVLESFKNNLYADDFVYTVPRDFVRTVQAPLLVLAGNDQAHPFQVAEEISKLAPKVEFIPEWKSEPHLTPAMKRVREFLLEHTPVPAAR